jgi:hypothetical protein
MSFNNIGKFVLHIITNGEKEKCWHPATITDCFLKEKEYKITYDTFGTCNVHEKDVYFFEDVDANNNDDADDEDGYDNDDSNLQF